MVDETGRANLVVVALPGVEALTRDHVVPAVHRDVVGHFSAAVTAPILGPRTEEHLDGAVKALEIHLDEHVLARLDPIFPGYKKAPVYYAG